MERIELATVAWVAARRNERMEFAGERMDGSNLVGGCGFGGG
jgi:hypothetical protein